MRMESIIISNLHQAKAAVETAQDALLMIADPNLVGVMGVGYFSKITKGLGREFPSLKLSLAIPCHHCPSLVFSALKEDVQGIFFEDTHELWSKIVSMGQNQGIFVKPMSEVNHGMAPL